MSHLMVKQMIKKATHPFKEEREMYAERMRKRFMALAIAITLLPLPALSASSPKTGASCTKNGVTKTHKAKTFTCRYKKGQLVWSKGVPVKKTSSIPIAGSTPLATPTPTTTNENTQAIPAATPREFEFETPCDPDPETPAEWKEMESYFSSINFCQGIYRIKKVVLGESRPTVSLTALNNSTNVDECRVENPGNGPILGFPNADQRSWQNPKWSQVLIPSPQMSIQIIPIYSSDSAKPINSPAADYGKYFRFIQDWINYASDLPSTVDIRVPDKYFEFTKELKPFGVNHDKNSDQHRAFTQELITQVDPLIDFTGATFALTVVPPNTSNEIFHQAALGSLNTREGTIHKSGSLPPEYFKGSTFYRHVGLIQPNWMIHELFHVGVGFYDRYGNGNFFNNLSAGKFESSGLGGMTLMSTSRSDLSVWEKWVVGFISDDQVICADGTNPFTAWVSPSTYKSTEKKLLAIPLSKTKVIVVESIRSAGLSVKLNRKSHGAFVYVVDAKAPYMGDAIFSLYPNGRNAEPPNNRAIYHYDAPLKLNESVEYDGVRLTVVETGEFGEVIKVERN
ncbi:MAG: hypothetical protein ACO39F_01820 [Candidatus Nanopelagicaceae bacterium]